MSINPWEIFDTIPGLGYSDPPAPGMPYTVHMSRDTAASLKTREQTIEPGGPFVEHLFGMCILYDNSIPPSAWRVLDRHGDELARGGYPPPEVKTFAIGDIIQLSQRSPIDWPWIVTDLRLQVMLDAPGPNSELILVPRDSERGKRWLAEHTPTPPAPGTAQ